MMTTIAFICVLFISSISIHGILCHKIRKTNFLNNRVLLFSISLLSILPLIIVGDILNLIFINIEIKKSNFDDIENKDIKKILKKYSLFSLWPKIVIFVYTIIIIFSTVFSNLDIPNTPENLIVLISFYVFVVFYGVSIPGYFIISLVSGILLFKEIKLLDKSYENKSILLLLSILSIFSISLNLIIILTFVIMKDNLFKKNEEFEFGTTRNLRIIKRSSFLSMMPLILVFFTTILYTVFMLIILWLLPIKSQSPLLIFFSLIYSIFTLFNCFI